MENNIKHNKLYCLRYWISYNYMKMINICIVFSIMIFWASLDFRGWGIFELVCIYLVGTSTVTIFSPLNVSLPFSRKELWDFHFWMQSILLGVFLLFGFISCSSHYVEMLTTTVCVLIVYYLEANMPTKPENTIYIIFSFLLVFAAPYLEKLAFFKKVTSMNGVRVSVFAGVLLVGIIIDLLHWKKRRTNFVSY